MIKLGSSVAANSFSLPITTYSPPPNLPTNRGDSLRCRWHRHRGDSLENLLNFKSPIPDLESAISDTVATSIYLTHKAPCANINSNTPMILVDTASRPPLTSSASCDLLIPNLHHIPGHTVVQCPLYYDGIGA